MTTRIELGAWLKGRLPDGWFTGEPVVTADREEILVVGPLADVELEPDASDAARRDARQARIARFREETRAKRMRIADELESKTGRKVSWGVELADERVLFTTISVPV